MIRFRDDEANDRAATGGVVAENPIERLADTLDIRLKAVESELKKVSTRLDSIESQLRTLIAHRPDQSRK